MKSLYKKKKLGELQDMCQKKGIDSSGLKESLIKRLEEHDRNTSGIFKIKGNNESGGIKNENKITPDIYYLQLKSSNVSNYFTFGYIYPLVLEESEIYKKENRAKDILSDFEEHIVLSQSNNVPFNDDDVLLELVLNNIRVQQYESSEIFYVSEPIPISRVKTIYFRNTNRKELFISSVNSFPDSFIPAEMCKVYVQNHKSQEVLISNIKLPKNNILDEWKDRLDRFDKLLGLFAFIKNTGIFYSEKENRLDEYTSGFIEALKIINTIPEFTNYKENAYLRPLIQPAILEIKNVQREIFKSIIERIYSNQTFDLKTAIQILETTLSHIDSQHEDAFKKDLEEQLNLFKQFEKLNISYKTVLSKESIQKNNATLSLLYLSKFSNKSRQNTDKQSVRISFIENEFNFTKNVAEYILGTLGLYYGYRNMVKKDTNLRFEDKVFSKIADSVQSIKFKLNSHFERFVIESVFQFSGDCKQLSNRFEYLDWQDGSVASKPVLNELSEYYYYSNISYSLLKHPILRLERVDVLEKMFDSINTHYSDSINEHTYLFSFFKKYFRIDKWYLLEILKKNKSKYSKKELESAIELDKTSEKKKYES